MSNVLKLCSTGQTIPPSEKKFWVGIGRMFNEKSGTVIVGPLCSSVEELEAVIAQLKSDLDQILQEAKSLASGSN